MKKIFTLSLMFFCLVSLAQDKVYVHTATAANTSGHVTYIDHPELNGQPDAPIVYVNNYNPGSTGGIYNNNVSGLWYDGSQWTIYNENLSDMVIGASFNIYIASDPNNVFTHVATPANSNLHETDMDNVLLNGNSPGPYLAFSHYYNPNSIYNTGNYGQYFSGSFRTLYDEGFTNVPEGAGFKVLVDGGTGATGTTHISTASNIVSNWTIIDHPLLNGNPNATFVMSHYWGITGATTQVYLDAVLGVWYTGTNWSIYIEDGTTAFPENVAFDIIIAPQEVLGVSDNEVAKMVMHPNPATSKVSFSAKNSIESVTIFNMQGQQILQKKGNENMMELDITSLVAGAYLAKVKNMVGIQTFKLMKE